MDHWSEEYADEARKCLINCKLYPDSLSKDGKRNFRKRDQDFLVVEEKMHYKCKNGETRLAICSKEVKESFSGTKISLLTFPATCSLLGVS